MEQRGTATDQLAYIIHIIQLARKSGQLMVEREGTTREEGNITFADGQVTEAQIGSLYGQAAFNHLNRWGFCYFTFIPTSATSNSSAQPVEPHRTRGNELPANNNYASEYMSITPQRILHPNEALPYFDAWGLSRAHRRVFLLIDGQRNIKELIRLLQQRSDEVSSLLSDLEQAGFIRH